ncbi:MAG: N,N'-diacetylchitobiose phosphorylase [Oscillospiraceae bacterium]|nr:N,N'-diacetylchitobiose phosphorylase [Oscillospiraceae bacterium]
MKYGYFDDARREYVIDRMDVPVSWTNYIGVEKMCAVLNHTSGGYLFYESPQYHRITRFRPNGTPLDRPGHYVYLRDNADGDYWSVSWQPVGKPLDQAKYLCRHGLSYSTYECEYKGIKATQTNFIPRGDDVYIMDVTVENTTDKPREFSLFGYAEFSYNHIDFDNQNFQMSNYCSGSSYADGMIELDLFYDPDGYQWAAACFEPDSFDCLRDNFLGVWHDERNPIAVEKGECTNSFEKTGNHCMGLHKKITIAPGESKRFSFMIGNGKREEGAPIREKYSCPQALDAARADLAKFWEDKLGALQINTPHDGMNTMLNTWTLYQSEINVMFSRFASFIEVGGRTGLGYRDTAQDAMCIPHSNPEKCRSRIMELLQALTTRGWGLHLFEPEWFKPKGERKVPAKSPTVKPEPDMGNLIREDLRDTTADSALWLVAAICEYIKETGEISLLDEVVGYAENASGNDISGSVYEHLTKILDFSAEQVGQTGICKGLRADWNDCLNLGGGESAMVSFLHAWALNYFIELCQFTGKTDDLAKYTAMRNKVVVACEKELWDGKWYARGITKNGLKIGTQQSAEGKVHMESNTWAVISGVAPREHALSCMDSVDEWLYTPWGLMLNAPSFTVPDDDIGYMTRVYPGVKENGAIFSHPNPWAWVAEAMLGRGERAMKFYDALLPSRQNEMIDIRQAEPYMYCQFVMGKDHTAHGRARHPWMTGSGGWAYFAATHYMVGVRPGYDCLTIDPCVPADWKGFTATRRWRGATYNITVENPNGVEKGVVKILVNGQEVDKITPCDNGCVCDVTVVMG